MAKKAEEKKELAQNEMDQKEIDDGMDEMSEKFKEMGGEVYVEKK